MRGVRKQLPNGLWLVRDDRRRGLLVGGYIALPPADPLAGLGAGARQASLLPQRRVRDARRRHAGPGQRGHGRGRARSARSRQGVAQERQRGPQLAHQGASYAHIHPDATMLLRPKTALKDMVAELDPGTQGARAARAAPRSAIGSTKPDVNFDEILAGSTPTRATRSCCWSAARARRSATATAAHCRQRAASASSRSRAMSAKATRAGRPAARQAQRLMHNLSLLAPGARRRATSELGTFVNSSDDVFRRFDNQNDNARPRRLELLPGTLQTAQPALAKLDKLGATLTDRPREARPRRQGRSARR